jgi:hypothetical protein
MAYIGRDTDKISNVEVLDNITFDGSSSYTLQKNSVNFTPSSANTLLLSIDGVVQAGNFTVSGSTIDFGVAIAGTSTCDFILHYGVGLITAPSDGTVTTAKLADSSVSLAKLTATGTKDATTFLRGDNSFGVPPLGGITMADQWRITANKSLSAGVASDITANWERIDSTGQGTLGTGMTESSGVFSFPSTGIYYVAVNLAFGSTGANPRYIETQIRVTTDNSSYNYVSRLNTSLYHISSSTYQSSSQATLIDVTDISNVKVMFRVESEAAVTISGNTDHNEGNMFTFIRLGDT